MLENATLSPLASPQRPYRVAVIGSGPSGFYAAEALLNAKDKTVQIDMFDRLPTPYGLVRGGVAPDHQKIKGVIAVYERIALKPGFRFFGNVKFGTDLTIEDVRRHYDAVVYAVGNESDKKMGIPGEDLAGSHSATAFVGWYNGHPDWRGQKFDLAGTEAVAVVGVGNVAMDVTRVLAEDSDQLASTDIAGYALEALRRSKVKTVYLLGRRGPAQAAFSPAEIKEIGGLESADLVVRPDEMVLDDASRKDLADPEAKKNVDFLNEAARRGEGSRAKKVRARFLVSPVEVLGENGRVTAVKIEKNKLVVDEKGDARPKGTGRFETLKVGLIFRSVGYYGIPLPGVPFDQKSGHIPNKDGRVLDAGGRAVPGAYVVGWAKRGPSGLIGTNRADSVATVQAMLADIAGKTAAADAAKTSEASLETIRRKSPRLVTFQDWKRLDQAEVERGKKAGKIREKFTTVPEMLDAISGAAQPAA